MIYDLQNELDRKRFVARVRKLYNNGAVCEVTEKAVRTAKQNSYLHVIIGIVAMETGVSIDYCKEEYFKRLCNKDVFIEERSDKYLGKVEIVRSSANISKEDMSMSIDRFKRWAYEQGIYLPSPEEESLLRQAEIEIGRMRQWL